MIDDECVQLACILDEHGLGQNVFASQEPVQRADILDRNMTLKFLPKGVMVLCRTGKEQVVNIDSEKEFC